MKIDSKIRDKDRTNTPFYSKMSKEEGPYPPVIQCKLSVMYIVLEIYSCIDYPCCMCWLWIHEVVTLRGYFPYSHYCWLVVCARGWQFGFVTSCREWREYEIALVAYVQLVLGANGDRRPQF